MAANVTHALKNHPGRVLVLVLQTHNLFPETEQGVLMTETAAHPYGERMTAIVPRIIGRTIHLMKRGENLTPIARSHAMTHVTATMIGTSDKITQAGIVISSSRDLQDFLLRSNLWTVRTRAIGSLMTLTLVAPIPGTVTSHLLEMTALAVFNEETIILLMILLTRVLGVMIIRLVVVLEQQNVPGILNPSTDAPIPWSCGILTPKIKVRVDHRL
jgi:hypothetical protein